MPRWTTTSAPTPRWAWVSATWTARGGPFSSACPFTRGGQEVGLPRSTFTGSWWNRASVEQTVVYADLDHRFNTDWKLKVSALRMSERNTSTHQRMTGTVAADGSGPTYDDWITDLDSTKVGLDAYVRGRFDVGGLGNEV